MHIGNDAGNAIANMKIANTIILPCRFLHIAEHMSTAIPLLNKQVRLRPSQLHTSHKWRSTVSFAIPEERVGVGKREHLCFTTLGVKVILYLVWIIIELGCMWHSCRGFGCDPGGRGRSKNPMRLTWAYTQDSHWEFGRMRRIETSRND